MHVARQLRVACRWVCRKPSVFIVRAGCVAMSLCPACAGRCGGDPEQPDSGSPEHAPSTAPVVSVSGAAASGSEAVPPPDQPSPSTSPASGCPPGMVKLEGGRLSVRRKKPVRMKAMCMDRLEVSVVQYAKCADQGACREPAAGKACNWGVAGREQHPVNCVSLDDAEAYCRWRDDARVPTHDEWEWAAAGRDAATTYPWGDDPPGDRACWSGDTKRSGTCSVGSHPSGDSPQGIGDLSGNVAEWTTTVFSEGLGTFMVRGGSWWDSNAEMLRTNVTSHDGRKSRFDGTGFRCVKDAPSK